MATASLFRRIALGMKDAIEKSHMGHPDFRANGKIFATLHHDDKYGMVKVTPEQQQALIDEHPDVFTPEAGAWGRQGCTRVTLARVDESTLGEALTLAWQASAAAKPAVRSKTRRTTTTARRSLKR